MKRAVFALAWAVMMSAIVSAPVSARPAPQEPAAAERGVPLPSEYVIGTDDVLNVAFWNEKDLSSPEVTVRPDGKITLPLLKDVQAAGLTPEQLSAALAKAATKYLKNDPQVTVMVTQIRSRKVYIVGEVVKGVAFPLNVDMNVLQLITAAGGLLEWANKGDIVVIRTENGRETRLKFNYNDAVKGKNPKQNIMLRPGDQVVVQ
jgi:polysaccharide export outer membrane protein